MGDSAVQRFEYVLRYQTVSNLTSLMLCSKACLIIRPQLTQNDASTREPKYILRNYSGYYVNAFPFRLAQPTTTVRLAWPLQPFNLRPPLPPPPQLQPLVAGAFAASNYATRTYEVSLTCLRILRNDFFRSTG